MHKDNDALIQKLARLNQMRENVSVGLINVRNLLARADERRLAEDNPRWDLIIENLERALLLLKSNLTSYEQQIKELERRLQGVMPSSDFSSLTTQDMEAVERLLAMPLDKLSALTMEEVSHMHEQLFAMQTPPQAPDAAQPATVLSARIKHARRIRDDLKSARKRSKPSFMEKRKQMVLRSGVDKLLKGTKACVTLEEIEAMLEYHETLSGLQTLSPTDLRLRDIIDGAIVDLKAMAAARRKKNNQKYLR